MSRRGWALFLAMGAIWGTPYFMIRVAVRQLDPGALVFGRTLVASVILLPLALRRGSLTSLRGRWGWLVVYTVVEIAIPWVLLAAAEQHLTSSFSGLLIASVPLVAIVLTRLYHPADRITPQRLGGLLVGFAGVVVLVGLDVRGSSAGWLAVMAVVIVCYAVGPMVLAFRLREAESLGVVAASVALVAIGYLPWGVTHWPSGLTAETYWSVVGLAIVCTAFAFMIFFALIREVGPARSVVITYVNTAVAVVIGVVGLHEPLTTGIAIGFPLIVAGSFFATSAARSSAEVRADSLRGLDEPLA